MNTTRNPSKPVQTTSFFSSTKMEENEHDNDPFEETVEAYELDVQPIDADDEKQLDRLFHSAFFDTLESHEPTAVLPKYLRYLLILNGFDNYHAFSTLDDADVDALERFGREELADHLARNVPFLPEHRRHDFYYESWTSGFKICLGHRKLMMALAAVCKSMRGELFLPGKVKKKRRKLSDLRSPKPPAVVTSDTDRAVATIVTRKVAIKDKAQRTFEPSPASVTDDLVAIVNRSMKALFPEYYADFEVSEACPEDLYVVCSVCDQPMSVTSRSRNGKESWITSNVARHMRSKHVPRPDEESHSHNETRRLQAMRKFEKFQKRKQR